MNTFDMYISVVFIWIRGILQYHQKSVSVIHVQVERFSEQPSDARFALDSKSHYWKDFHLEVCILPVGIDMRITQD